MALDLPFLVQSLSTKEIAAVKILDIQSQLAEQLLASPIQVAFPITPSASFKSMEMEKSKAHAFSGHTIDYPDFKGGWNNEVACVHWDDGN